MPLPPQSEQQPKETETYHQSLEATKKRPEPNPLSEECYLTICYFLSQQAALIALTPLNPALESQSHPRLRCPSTKTSLPQNKQRGARIRPTTSHQVLNIQSLGGQITAQNQIKRISPGRLPT
ncbi:hypothetical protein D5086_009806 [Populus alba]|uniref:Uncharacterized protein n=1 Tax=Populus alba TaxID=43335 RepID=A0ACC4C933_POPAL